MDAVPVHILPEAPSGLNPLPQGCAAMHRPHRLPLPSPVAIGFQL